MIALTLFELLLFQAERLQVTGSNCIAGRTAGKKLGRKLLRVFAASCKKTPKKPSVILGTVTL